MKNSTHDVYYYIPNSNDFDLLMYEDRFIVLDSNYDPIYELDVERCCIYLDEFIPRELLKTHPDIVTALSIELTNEDMTEYLAEKIDSFIASH